MKKLITVIGLVLSCALHADEPQRVDHACRRTVMAPSQTELENFYFSLADLSLEDQREQMWPLSSSTKAALWTYNAERYLRNHPELSADGQEVLRRGIALINTPAWFDIQEGSIGYPAKRSALAEFKRDFEKTLPADVIYEVLIRLGPEPTSSESSQAPTITRSRQPSIQPDSFVHCHCGSGFDCASSSSYDCYDAWCIPTPSHCGPYADDPCWGKCKSTG